MPSGGKVGGSFRLTFDPDLASMRVAFEDWSRLVGDWKPAWKHLRVLFRKHEARHLNSEGLSTGGQFPALSDRYGKWKAKNYGSGLPILQREEVLFRALVEGGPGSIDKMTKDSFTIGIKPTAVVSDPRTGKPYHLGEAAKAHAQGLGVPKRPPIRFDGNVQDRRSFAYAASQILQAHIVKARRKAFKKDIDEAIGGRAGPHKSPDATINSILSREWR